METPSIGRIVIYRSKTGNYSLSALVTATEETLWPEGVERGDVPALTGPGRVHLHVFSPADPLGYVEHDVPFDEDFGPIAGEYDSQAPGTWRWPVRV